MPLGSSDYGRRRGAYSDQEYAMRRSDRHPRFHDLQKTYSDNRYDRHVRYDRTRNEDYDEWNDYKREKRRLARFRGGADSDMDCCQQFLSQLCRKDNQDDDSDICNPDRYRGKRRERDPCGDYNGMDSDLERDRCRYKKSQRDRCGDSEDYDDPCGDRDGRRNRDRHQKKRHRRDKSRRRRSDRYDDDGCDDMCRKPREDPCVNIHKVSHVCSGPMTSSSCNPKSCLAFKPKNKAGGDATSECCSCDTCPFCMLRQFCSEVLQELAEIKAKQIGGELEGLIYAPDVELVRPSELAFSKKKGYSEDSMGLHKRTKSSEFGMSTDSLGRKRRRRSDDDYSRDDSRGRRGRDDYSRDDMRGRRGRRSYDSLDGGRGRDRDGRGRDRDRRGDRDDGNGKGKDKDKKGKDKKKEKEKEEKPAELPEDVKKELEKAQKKAEKDKKKKEAERAKKALIEMRLIQSSQLANKGCRAFSVKPYSGPGRFAEVNICDFMKMRLESLIERESAMKRSMCCPPPCPPPCMPPTCCINPKYCCTSFWCPQPTVPAICC